MVNWLVIRSEDTGKVLDCHAYKTYKQAEKARIGVEEGYSIPITVNIELLSVGEYPRNSN